MESSTSSSDVVSPVSLVQPWKYKNHASLADAPPDAQRGALNSPSDTQSADDSPVGLSNVHISALPSLSDGFVSPRRRGSVSGSSALKLPLVSIPLGGGYLEVKGHVHPDSEGKKIGGARGVCREFTHGSQRRLRKKFDSVNRLAVEHKPLLLTQTYPAEYPDDPRVWKKHLDNFWHRLSRKYPGVAGIWVLEFQERGAPHFHWAIFNVAKLDIPWLSRAWYETVGSSDPKHLLAGTRVERLRDWDKGGAYIAKYCSKMRQKELQVPEGVGRWWGVRGRKHLPSEIYSTVIRHTEFYKLRRIAVRWIGSRMRAQAKRDRRKYLAYKRNFGRYQGITAFVNWESAFRVLNFLSCTGPPGGFGEWSRGELEALR